MGHCHGRRPRCGSGRLVLPEDLRARGPRSGRRPRRLDHRTPQRTRRRTQRLRPGTRRPRYQLRRNGPEATGHHHNQTEPDNAHRGRRAKADLARAPWRQSRASPTRKPTESARTQLAGVPRRSHQLLHGRRQEPARSRRGRPMTSPESAQATARRATCQQAHHRPTPELVLMTAGRGHRPHRPSYRTGL